MREWQVSIKIDLSRGFPVALLPNRLKRERRPGLPTLGLIDSALTLSREMGAHWSDALAHSIRGEILLESAR